jgi:hypothetical protein
VKKGLKISLWGCGTVVVLLMAIVFMAPSIFGWLLAPDHRFGDKPVPDPPDYSLRAHWAAWPDDASPAERLPEGVVSTPQADRMADAFFLHPTTYGGTEHWVQPVDDEETWRGTDLGTISRQASVFNGCCRVYAPRYRQSNLVGLEREEDQREIVRILDVGYQDVRAAFHHFIAEIEPNGPIVLGSHSQGTFHLVRLVMEEIEGTPLMDRVVAVYAIGISLSHALIEEGFREIDICGSPTQTGCFITWDAHEGDRNPSMWSDKDDHVIWNGIDYSGFDPSQRICVNPIDWTTDGRPSAKDRHLGALPYWDGFTEIDTPLPGLVAGTVSATCEEGERSNWLWVNGDRDPSLKAEFPWSLFVRNLHGMDYSLFWANIRQNAMDRTRAFVDAKKAMDDFGNLN